MEKRIPKHERERKITCRCCQRETSEDAIAYLKPCPRCVAALARVHKQELKLEKVRQRHKRLID